MIKYTARDFRGDVIAGSFNGMMFGLTYSFYFLPQDRLDTKYFQKFRNNRFIYFAVNGLKMAAGFSIMRCTYNGLKKQECEK